ncbi:MAG: hypothetical protein ACYDH0_10480 [Candidatus Aminicenantales bacterium]
MKDERLLTWFLTSVERRINSQSAGSLLSNIHREDIFEIRNKIEILRDAIYSKDRDDAVAATEDLLEVAYTIGGFKTEPIERFIEKSRLPKYFEKELFFQPRHLHFETPRLIIATNRELLTAINNDERILYNLNS